MLADDSQPAGATVDQSDRHGRHPRTDREGVAAAGPVADDLADELMTHHDVAVGVVQRAPGRIVEPSSGWSMKWTSDAQIAVLNAAQQITLSWNGIAVSRTSARRLSAPLHAKDSHPCPYSSRIIDIKSLIAEQ